MHECNSFFLFSQTCMSHTLLVCSYASLFFFRMSNTVATISLFVFLHVQSSMFTLLSACPIKFSKTRACHIHCLCVHMPPCFCPHVQYSCHNKLVCLLPTRPIKYVHTSFRMSNSSTRACPREHLGGKVSLSSCISNRISNPTRSRIPPHVPFRWHNKFAFIFSTSPIQYNQVRLRFFVSRICSKHMITNSSTCVTNS